MTTTACSTTTARKSLRIKFSARIDDDDASEGRAWGSVEIETSLSRDYPEDCTTEKERTKFDARLAQKVLKEAQADVETVREADSFARRVIDECRRYETDE